MRATFLCFLALHFSPLSSLHAKEMQVPLHFDFGPERSRTEPGFIAVGPRSLYSTAKGYGLIEPASSTFSRLLKRDYPYRVGYYGVVSQNSLEFRVDIASGKYWVEILMAGGEKTTWKGEIRANGDLLADTLYTSETSVEDESPPVHWAILRHVETGGGSLLIKVSASDQDSTLAGLSIYKDEIGPLALEAGQITAEKKLRAPNATLALKLINSGNTREAHRVIDPLPEKQFRYEKAILLLALAGRLEIENPRPLVEWAVHLLRQEVNANGASGAAFNLRLAELYLLADQDYKLAGWEWAKKLTGEGLFSRLNTVGLALEEIAQVRYHPLYHAAVWHLGKLAFWSWVEQHGPPQLAKAEECFAVLKEHYPDHRLLNMYSGEQFPFRSTAPSSQHDGIPNWALSANRALQGVLEIIHYWVGTRQAENGEFGGKFDDDVEMLRWWPIARLAADDQVTLAGMRRLVDGIWNSDWITHGFSRRIRDVEHAAEPVADTQPMMIGLDYGNPVYVERCMESIRGLRDLWTGVNSRGHRHFKSSWYSSTEIDVRPPRDCDVPMNTRTVRAARWLAWYNRHPFAMQFLREWGDAWLEDCLRTDKGKPYGIPPAAVRFEDDALGGHADNWHHPDLFWDYYNFHGGVMMFRQLLVNYLLFDDLKYLKPIELALDLVARHQGKSVEGAPAGSEAWVAGILRNSEGFRNTVAQWRLLTSNPDFDDLLREIGSEYLKFRLTNDRGFLVKGSLPIIERTTFNRELLTTEAYFTDRVEIRNIHGGKNWGTSHLESMYTGSTLSDGFYPFYSVSWDGLGSDFAAVVLESNREQLRILAYNLSEETRQGQLFCWNLVPGQFEFLQGPDENADGVPDEVVLKDKFEISGRISRRTVTLPPQSPQIIHIRMAQPNPEQPSHELADLAISTEEIEIREAEGESVLEVVIPVHNIGIVKAENVEVQIRKEAGGSGTVLAKEEISQIEAPLDLEPRVIIVHFQVPKSDIGAGSLVVEVDPQDHVREITELNNLARISIGN